MVNALLIIVIFCALLLVTVVACGDDDDDDDDDDDFGSGMDQCISMEMKCFGFDASAALLVCEEYYNLEQACSQGATDTFLKCVGTDRANWADCAADWEDTINC
jgi:hypothetical protein